MHAVFQTGGKQYRVKEGQTLKVEKLTVEPGSTVNFDSVLMLSDGDQITVGTPLVAGGKVTAEVQSQGRAPKVEIIKFRRRKHYRRRMGHRQSYTELRITGISAGGAAASAQSEEEKA